MVSWICECRHFMWLSIILLLSLNWNSRLCQRTVSAENPTSIIPPIAGPDPGYIIAQSDSGLGNRLRVMAAYMHIAEYKFDGAHLVFIWEKNEACPGHFLSVFEPIPRVIFANNESRYVLDKRAKMNYENSWAVFSWIMQMNDIPRRHPSWGEIEYKMYSRYFPRRELMYLALDFIERHNICNASAMHIRQTDMALSVERKSHGRRKISIHGYVRYVESLPPEEPVFLMTDSPETQQYFLNQFGPKKILVYSLMNDTVNQLPMQIESMKDLPKYHKLNVTAEDHRYTTLDNTVIEVVIAAHARHFKPAIFSSMSELVSTLSTIGKRNRGWCTPMSTARHYQ